MSNRAGSFEPFLMPRFDAKPCASIEGLRDTGTVEAAERVAFECGFAQGEKAGFDIGERKAAVLLEKVHELICDLADLEKSITREFERQAVDLALVIARKIILREVSVDPEIIVEMTKEALTRLEKSGQITVRMHPALQELFMKHRPELLNLHADIVLEADSSVSSLGAVVRGASEEVSTDIEDQLAVIEAEMKELRAYD